MVMLSRMNGPSMLQVAHDLHAQAFGAGIGQYLSFDMHGLLLQKVAGS